MLKISVFKCIPEIAIVITFLLFCVHSANAVSYNTKKALIEVNDPKAERNPVKSVRADTWKAVEVRSKIKPRPGQDIAVVCEGGFPAGIIANDLFRQNGEFNRDFKVTASTTVLDICNQQEDAMRIRNPRLFK